jgi:hypothetical protein
MNDAPNDILCLIFDTYIHVLGRSPANILTVNRRRYATLVETGTLWTQIPIIIDSFDTIPHLIGICKNPITDLTTAPLLAYLIRSHLLPLDISIYWKMSENRNSNIDAMSCIANVSKIGQALIRHPTQGIDIFDVNGNPNTGPITNHENVRRRQTQELIISLSGRNLCLCYTEEQKAAG